MVGPKKKEVGAYHDSTRPRYWLNSCELELVLIAALDKEKGKRDADVVPIK